MCQLGKSRRKAEEEENTVEKRRRTRGKRVIKYSVIILGEMTVIMEDDVGNDG